jgi:hypothetical protein
MSMEPRRGLPAGALGAGLMAFLLVLYLALAGQRAILFISSGQPIAIAIGVALLVLPILGLWALVRELMFGVRSQQLADRLAAAGELPLDDVPLRASGRPDRAAADERFPIYKEAVERAPEDWGAWFRLGLAYDACGDRKRARQAVRRAIGLARDQRA